jgi:hypothetical protein
MESKVQHDAVDAYEALVQFLYRAPIGLAQTSLDGTVDMLNPMASRLLMPLATAQGLDNLFDVLAPVAPHLASMVEAFLEPSGMICEGLRLPVGVPHAASGSLQVLALNLMKLDPERLMATVADATFEVQREQEVLSRRTAQCGPHRHADPHAQPRSSARRATAPAGAAGVRRRLRGADPQLRPLPPAQ